MSGISWDSRWKFSTGLSKLSLTSLEECFDVLFQEISNLFITFSLWAKTWIDSWRKAFSRIVKLLRVQRNILRRNIFFERTKTIFYRLPDFERNFLGPLAKNFRQSCQKWFLRVQRKNCGKFFEKVTLFSPLSEYKWRTVNFLTEKFRQAHQKCNLNVQGNILNRNYFFEKNIYSFRSFLVLEPFFLALWREYFSTVVQNAFYVSSGKGVWEKIFF